jgi:hypothetical protein
MPEINSVPDLRDWFEADVTGATSLDSVLKRRARLRY